MSANQKFVFLLGSHSRMSSNERSFVTLVGTLWHFPLAGKIICSVLAGLLFLRMFVIYHDQQHRAILPKSRLAEALMGIFGILALSPTSIWKSSHNHHHNHNSKLRGSHIGSFPIMTKDQFLKSSKRERPSIPFHAPPVNHLVRLRFRFSRRDVHFAIV